MGKELNDINGAILHTVSSVAANERVFLLFPLFKESFHAFFLFVHLADFPSLNFAKKKKKWAS